MIQTTIDSLDYTIQSCEDLLKTKKNIEDNKANLEANVSTLSEKLKFLKEAKNKYTIAVNALYEDSVVALKDTLNIALKYIIFDKNYSANLVLEDRAGNKTLNITLKDDDEEDFEVDLKDGVGQGVRTIISFVLKSYYLLNQNSRVLFLDEKYSALSSHYVPKFYEFIEKFCEENDFIIVMISHIDNQIANANKIYYLNDGVISEENIDSGLTTEEKDVKI